MCCAGRHACHAAVLKQTDPVLVLVLDFQIFKIFVKYFFSKILRTQPACAATAGVAAWVPGCSVNTANNQIEEPKLVPTMLVRLFWWSPCPSGLNEGHRPVSPDGQWVRLG